MAGFSRASRWCQIRWLFGPGGYTPLRMDQPEGEALLTLLLGNLEHFINHQYQLFAYLKMLGVPLGTRDLYVWRGR